jgi:hypothetical protein
MSYSPPPITGKPLKKEGSSRILDIQSQTNSFWPTSPSPVTQDSDIIANETKGPCDLTQQVCKPFIHSLVPRVLNFGIHP